MQWGAMGSSGVQWGAPEGLPQGEEQHLPGSASRLRTYPSRRLPGEVHGVDVDGDGGHPLLGFPEVVSERGHLPLGHDQDVLLEACEGQRRKGAMQGGCGNPSAAPRAGRGPRLTDEDPGLLRLDPQVQRVGLPPRRPQAAQAEGTAEQHRT